MPGGARNQISFFDEPVTNGSFCPSPDHNGFLFTKDIGGNEFSQIYWYDMKTRVSEMISDGQSRNFGILWSNAGDKFAFTSSRRNNKDFDIYVSDIATPKKSTIKMDRGNGYWVATDWSPDDTKLIVIQYLSSTKSNSFILDLKTNELTQINDNKTEATFIAVSWDHTGKRIYATTNQGREFNTLVEYNVDTGKIKYITDSIPWDIDEFATNKAKTWAAFTVNENGFSQLYLFDIDSGRYKKVSSLPVGQIYSISFHPTKEILAMVMNTTVSPGDIYTLDLQTMKNVRWTTSEVGGLDTSSFPKPELISYETYDEIDGKKRLIPAFVYKPPNSDGPLPVMISIHGGPEGQHTPRFSSFYAFLANEMGIAVIAPNVRGSAGYGKTYLKLDNGFNRENSVMDIGKLIEWIQDQPEFDKERIAVFGGSYGGYMVLSSMYNHLLRKHGRIQERSKESRIRR
jgi:dipeptidyl aminopeptidase/acylaminoacyl peptidase